MKTQRTKTRMLALAAAAMLVVGVTSESDAGITYVDATPNTTGADGNTTIDGALVDFTAGTGNAQIGASTVDELWGMRTDFGNGGNVWEGKNGEDLLDSADENLITTISLAPGTYNLYGLFWNGVGATPAQDWQISYRVGNAGAYTLFAPLDDSTPLAAADGSDFDNAVTTRLANDAIQMHIASLGQFVVTGTVEIYVEHTDLDTTDDRAWHDGVGYELVPEPASLALLGMGGLMLLKRRRNA